MLDGPTVDWVNIMTYDFHAPWNSATGMTVGAASPLFPGLFNTNNRNRNSVHSAPVLDVKTVAAILKDRFGFDTTVLINPTKKEFINAILQYNKITFDSSSQFFLFIAGHGGYTDMAPGYIVFKDTKGPEEAKHTLNRKLKSK